LCHSIHAFADTDAEIHLLSSPGTVYAIQYTSPGATALVQIALGAFLAGRKITIAFDASNTITWMDIEPPGR
jgi:hypothetical protein